MLKQFFSVVSFLLALILLLHSTLTYFQAPTLFLWKAAIVATEFGHWVALFCLLVAASTLALKSSGKVFRSFSNAACFLFLVAVGFYLRPSFLALRHGAPFFELGRSLFSPWRTEPVVPQKISLKAATGEDLSFLYYENLAHKVAPCVVVIHGGSWNSGDTNELDDLNWRLAREGYNVASIDYRVAPTFHWPSQRDDVLLAIHYLKSQAETFKIDASRWVLLGRSAGGQIAEAVGYGSQEPGLRGVVAFYAPSDLTYAFKYSGPGDLLSGPDLIGDYLGGDPDKLADLYQSASALALVNQNSPPTLLIHGRRDELVWSVHSARLFNRLNELRVPAEYLDLEWATHGFDYNLRGPGGFLSTRAILNFLKEVFN